MRDRAERFVAFPFSLGCVSHASIAVVEDRPRRTKPEPKSPTFGGYEAEGEDEDEDEESLCSEGLKHSSRFMIFPKPKLSSGVNKLVKGFKSLSQLFMDEDEMDELGIEMEIGRPTNVKHVAHIGLDGTTTTHLTTTDESPLLGWHHLFSPELLPRRPTPPLSPASGHPTLANLPPPSKTTC